MTLFVAGKLFNKAGEGSGGGGGGDQHNLGYYATQAALEEAHPTAEAGDWAIVGATDTVWIWDDDNSAWVDSDQKGQVTSVNNQTGAVTITAADIGAATQTTATITLASTDWSSHTQTKTVSGVTADNTVIVSPVSTSAADYAAAEVYCTAQAANSLTFSCTTDPTNNLSVNIVILN